MSKNTLALITGANKGIGFETARQLGLQGIHIIIGTRDKARGEEAVQKLAALDVHATFVELDVTDEESISRAAHYIADCRLSNNFFHLSNNFSPVFERKTTAPKEGSAT